MANRFDEILDECIDLISLQGETVEECLARYPDLAEELEPHLRVSSRMAQAYAFTPSPTAKAAGRQRLQGELRELQREGNQRKVASFPLGSLLESWRLRGAAAAAVVLLAVMIGGGGMVRASGDTLPGETLYPVKRAAEEARLAFQFSDAGKAELHLAHAERRASEVSTLLAQGDTSRVQPALDLLQQDINSVTGIAQAIPDDETASRLNSHLEDSASQSLALLQETLEEVPEANREAASDSFLLTSRVYGDALESVSARSEDRYVTEGLGSIQLWAADPPPPDVEQVLIEMDRVEAHLASGKESRWVVITDEPATFDLLRVAQVQKFLGEQQVKAGTYTRLRFSVASVTVIAAGVEHAASVPSGYVNLPRPFRVAGDRTTVVVLDFDGQRSLRVTGQDRYMLTPVVRVMAQEPGRGTERSDQSKGDAPGNSDREINAPSQKESPGKRAEVEGDVESIDPDSLIVGGKRIAINPDTQTTAKPELGQQARVEVTIQRDGSLMATRVESSERPQQSQGSGGKSRGETRDSELSEVEIEGKVQKISEGEWVVGGRVVRVKPETRINRAASIGDSARIKGTEQDDGTILANQIIVTPAAAQPSRPDARGGSSRGGKAQGNGSPSP
jgi:hypothetical protein